MNSKDGTVCSYQLLNSDDDQTDNVFEIQLSGLKNIEIGLYYGQFENEGDIKNQEFELKIDNAGKSDLAKQLDQYKRLIDLKIFEPSECNDLLHCTVSSKEVDDEDRYI